MTVLALAPQRLTLVSLIGDGRTPLLTRLMQGAAFRDTLHIPVRGDTTAHRNLSAARIDAAIARADRAVLLIAEGAECAAAAWWARLSPASYVSRVAGALMLAPHDRAHATGFASPRSALPFPSIVVGADDVSQRLADEWGSRLVDGPLAIGQGAPSGRFQAIIARFTSAIVESDVQSAERLIAALGDR